MDLSKFGIYLNVNESKVVRINSPYWIPSGEEWVYLTPEVNMTLLKIRGLVKSPDEIMWGSIPVLD